MTTESRNDIPDKASGDLSATYGQVERDRLDDYLLTEEGRDEVEAILGIFGDFHTKQASGENRVGTIRGELMAAEYPAMLADDGRVFDFRTVEYAAQGRYGSVSTEWLTSVYGVSFGVYEGQSGMVFMNAADLYLRSLDPNRLLEAHSTNIGEARKILLSDTRKAVLDGGVVTMIGFDSKVYSGDQVGAFVEYEKRLKAIKDADPAEKEGLLSSIRQDLKLRGIYIIDLKFAKEEAEITASPELVAQECLGISIGGMSLRTVEQVRVKLGYEQGWHPTSQSQA